MTPAEAMTTIRLGLGPDNGNQTNHSTRIRAFLVTMTDPYLVLGLPTDSSDEQIRRRYLELVRTHTPDRAPERFAEVREAYEKLRDPIRRLRYRLFEAGQDDSLDSLIADARCDTGRRRATLEQLLALGRKRL